MDHKQHSIQLFSWKKQHITWIHL